MVTVTVYFERELISAGKGCLSEISLPQILMDHLMGGAWFGQTAKATVKRGGEKVL